MGSSREEAAELFALTEPGEQALLAVPGFRYTPDVITTDEEQALLAQVEHLELRPFVFHGIEARRRVAAFGLGYSFGRRALTEAPPLPDFLVPLAERVAPLAGIAASLLTEALVTDYPVGAGIGWHRDAPPFDVIIGVSLLSPCTFRLRPYLPSGTARRGQPRPLRLELAPRSAYVMAGSARTDWEHSIPDAIMRRVSITFRSMRRGRTRR